MHRVAARMVVTALLASGAGVSYGDAFLPGDLNNDRTLNLVDATVLRRALVGLGPGISQTCDLPVCGDGVVAGREACDQTDLSGSTCQSLGLGGGTLACTASCTFDTTSCSPCSDLIYLIDDTSHLLSFDPRKVNTAQDPFVVIGPLNCPATGGPLPGWGGGVGPYSLAIARSGFGRVLYTNGQLFSIDLSNASCAITPFQPGQGNQWLLFKQAFSTDLPGTTSETEFVGGGSVNGAPGELFGSLDPDTLVIATRGSLPLDAELGPDLTGLGDGTLFGFYPGTSTAFIQQIDKATGSASGGKLSIAGGLGNFVSSWAFAHWGGSFYLFVTTEGPFTPNSTVRRIDRSTGQYAVILQNLPRRFSIANVATCAPLEHE